MRAGVDVGAGATPFDLRATEVKSSDSTLVWQALLTALVPGSAGKAGFFLFDPLAVE